MKKRAGGETTEKYYKCAKYDECLDSACARSWDNWDCRQCKTYKLLSGEEKENGCVKFRIVKTENDIAIEQMLMETLDISKEELIRRLNNTTAKAVMGGATS